jgi:hypothetical protein
MPVRTAQSEEHGSEIETIREGRLLIDEWFDLYNQNRSVAGLTHYPVVSFCGARPGRSNLSFALYREPGSFGGGAGGGYRDTEWGFSLIDSIAVLQPTAVKGHTVVNFRRLRPDGATYGVAISRLAIHTKLNGRWAFQLVSSCGLRDPIQVYDGTDEPIMAEARRVVEASLDAYNRRDLPALRDVCHFPFVTLDRLDFSITDEPGDLSPDFGALQQSGWDRSIVRYLDVLTPQAHDKVIVDLTVARFDAGGNELPPEGSVYLVTRQHGRWGIQCSSTRFALGGLL